MHYDQTWSKNTSPISPRIEQRINQTLALIPRKSRSILDIGCGDGRITNRLIVPRRRVIGLESSREALRHVVTERIQGSIDYLPLADKSFDLVICTETLEHLPFQVYPRSLEEMQRVAAKHIVVTVPYSEDRSRNFVTCPICGCVFHPSRHLRSFTLAQMRKLFTKFELQKLQLFQLPTKRYPSVLLKVARFAGLIHFFPAESLCPQCGYSSLADTEVIPHINKIKKTHIFIHLLGVLVERLIPTRKCGIWLMAVYTRRTTA